VACTCRQSAGSNFVTLGSTQQRLSTCSNAESCSVAVARVGR
jgi:hypothetical protein